MVPAVLCYVFERIPCIEQLPNKPLEILLYFWSTPHENQELKHMVLRKQDDRPLQ